MNLSASIDIDRPVAEVFDYVMDVRHDVEWRTGIDESAFTSPESLGVGTTGSTRADNNGREMVVTWTVFEYQRGVLARWTLDSGPILGTGGYICEPAGSGTRFTLEAHVTPAGWYRLLGPIFGVIGRRGNRADVQKLKEILESTT